MGVKEYRSLENSADRLVSFACPIPETLGELDTAERVKAIRQVILLRVFGVNEEAEHAEKF